MVTVCHVTSTNDHPRRPRGPLNTSSSSLPHKPTGPASKGRATLQVWKKVSNALLNLCRPGSRQASPANYSVAWPAPACPPTWRPRWPQAATHPGSCRPASPNCRPVFQPRDLHFLIRRLLRNHHSRQLRPQPRLSCRSCRIGLWPHPGRPVCIWAKCHRPCHNPEIRPCRNPPSRI